MGLSRRPSIDHNKWLGRKAKLKNKPIMRLLPFEVNSELVEYLLTNCIIRKATKINVRAPYIEAIILTDDSGSMPKSFNIAAGRTNVREMK
jgi:hypothetical protein